MASYLDESDESDEITVRPPLPPAPAARPLQRPEQVFTPSARTFGDPRRFALPALREAFASDIDAANRADVLRAQHQRADVIDARRAEVYRQQVAAQQQKAAQRAQKEAEDEERRKINAQREAEFRSKGVRHYVDAYGLIQPERHEDGTPRYEPRVIEEGEDEDEGYYRRRIDDRGRIHHEDLNEYRVFDDQPTKIFRGGPKSSKLAGDRTGWKEYADYRQALASDNAALKAAGERARQAVEARLSKAAINAGTRARLAEEAKINQWRQRRAETLTRLSDIRREIEVLTPLTQQKQGGVFGLFQSATAEAERARAQIARLQQEEIELSDQLGTGTEREMLEQDAEASVWYQTAQRIKGHEELFSDLLRTEGDTAKAEAKFRELLGAEANDSPVLQGLEAERAALGLTAQQATPEEREAMLARWEDSDDPRQQQLAAKVRAIDARAKSLGGTGIASPEQAARLQAEIEAEYAAVQQEAEALAKTQQAEAQEKQRAERAAGMERRMNEFRAQQWINARNAAFNLGPVKGDGRRLREVVSGVRALGQMVGIPGGPLGTAAHEMSVMVKTLMDQGMDHDAAVDEAAKQLERNYTHELGGPEEARKWVEHLEGPNWGRDPYWTSPIDGQIKFKDGALDEPETRQQLLAELRAQPDGDIRARMAEEVFAAYDARKKEEALAMARKTASFRDYLAKHKGEGETDEQVFDRYLNDASAWDWLKAHGKALTGGGWNLLKSMFAGAKLKFGDLIGADPEKQVQALQDLLSGSGPSTGDVRFSGVWADTIGQQLPLWAAALIATRIGAGSSANAIMRLATGVSFGLAEAASNYLRVYEANIARDDDGNPLPGAAEQAHEMAMQTFVASTAGGFLELLPVERIFASLPAPKRLALMKKLSSDVLAETAQELAQQELSNIITGQASAKELAPERMSLEDIAGIATGVAAFTVPTTLLRRRGMVKKLAEIKPHLDRTRSMIAAAEKGLADYADNVAPTPEAIALGAFDPNDPVVNTALKKLKRLSAEVDRTAATDLDEHYEAIRALNDAVKESAKPLGEMVKQLELSAKLTPVAGEIEALTPESVSALLAGQGLDRNGLLSAPMGRAEWSAREIERLQSGVQRLRQSPRGAELLRRDLLRQQSPPPSPAPVPPPGEAAQSWARMQAASAELERLRQSPRGAELLRHDLRRREASVPNGAAAQSWARMQVAEAALQRLRQSPRGAQALAEDLSAQQAASFQVSPQYVARLQDTARGLVKLAIGRKDLMTPAEQEAVKKTLDGKADANRTYEFRGHTIITDAARENLIRLVPSAAKLFPQTEAQRKAAIVKAERQAEAEKIARTQPRKTGNARQAASGTQAGAATVKPDVTKEAATFNDVETLAAEHLTTMLAKKHGIEPTAAAQYAAQFVAANRDRKEVRNFRGGPSTTPLRIAFVQSALDQGWTTKEGRLVPPATGRTAPQAQAQAQATQAQTTQTKPEARFYRQTIEQEAARLPKWARGRISFDAHPDLERSGGAILDMVTGRIHIDPVKLAEQTQGLAPDQQRERIAKILREESIHALQLAAARQTYANRPKEDTREFGQWLKSYYGEMWEKEFSPQMRQVVEGLRGNIEEAPHQRALEGLRMLIQRRVDGTATEQDRLFWEEAQQNKSPKLIEFLRHLLDSLKRYAAGLKDAVGERARAEIKVIEELLADEAKAEAVLSPAPSTKPDPQTAAKGRSKPEARGRAAKPTREPATLLGRIIRDAEGVQGPVVGFNEEGAPVIGIEENEVHEAVAPWRQINHDEALDYPETPAHATREKAPKAQTPAPAKPATASQNTVDAAAHEAATSPANKKPEPTEAQQKAGNYAKGHIKIAGLEISIENPEGSVREGTDRTGKPWKIRMRAHYGYFRRTEGKDGDQVDVFIKKGTPEDYAGPVFVVDQIDPETGKFDEHKVILGVDSKKIAANLYRSHYTKGWNGLGDLTEMSVEQFKQWLKEGDTTKPLGKITKPQNKYGRSGTATLNAMAKAAGLTTTPDDSISDGESRAMIAFFEKFYFAGREGRAMPRPDMHPDDARKAYQAGMKDREAEKRKEKDEKVKPTARTYKEIGKNSAGNTLVEDERGIRGVRSGGFISWESVRISPTSEGMQIERRPHTEEYQTVEERQLKEAAPQLSEGEQALKDAFEGLASAPLGNRNAEYTANIPADKIGAFVSAAQKLIAEGVRTPEGLAKALDKIREGGALRKYSQAVWRAFQMVDTSLPSVKNWAEIYAGIDAAKQPKAATQPKPVEPPKSRREALERIAEVVRAKAAAQEKFTTKEVRETAHLGEVLTPKEIDEYIEVALVAVAREQIRQAESPEAAYQTLVALHDAQPKLNQKTSESKINQAYSTPLPLAYVASRLADIVGGKVVAERSFGHGALMMEADPSKQEVYLNEKDPQRVLRFKALAPDGFRTSVGDGLKWKPAKAPDRVIDNPPFGQVIDADGKSLKFETAIGETTSIDHALMLKSLEDMAPDGRAVFIIGGPPVLAKTEEQRKAHYAKGNNYKLWAHLHEAYRVVDHFTVSGDLYEKQGAGWPVDVVVIAGKGKSATEHPSLKVPRFIDSWEKLWQTTTLTDHERIALNRRSESEIREQVHGAVEHLGRLGHAADNMRRAVSGGSHDGSAGGVDSRQDAQGEPRSRAGGQNRVRGVSGEPDGRDDAHPSGDAGREPDRSGRAAGVGDTDRVSGGAAQTRLSSGVEAKAAPKGHQVPYRPVSGGKSMGTLVPVNMAAPVEEAMRRAHQEIGDFDAFVLKELGYPKGTDLSRYLAAEQVDAVAMAIWNFKKGGALVIGDQTGIGKGRIAAALMKYAVHQGKIPLFITKNPNLHDTMLTEDLVDIEAGEVVPAILDSKLQFNAAKERKLAHGEKYFEAVARDGSLGKGANAIFATYSQITADTARGLSPQDRARFVANKQAPPSSWRMAALEKLAPNLLVILDESHLAAGQSVTGWRISGLLEKVPMVYYSSATAVKRPIHLALYFRTDVGRVTNGKAEDLASLLESGGVPLMQVASAMLAANGQYIRRERSYDGVEFRTHIAKDTRERDAKLADGLTSALREIIIVQETMKNAADAINTIVETEGKRRGIQKSNRDKLTTAEFGSKIHNLVSQYLLAIKTEPAAKAAIDLIKQGKKVVVTVQNTMESVIDDIESGGFERTYKGIVLKELDKMRFIKIKSKSFGRGEDEFIEIKEEGPEHLRDLSDYELRMRLTSTETDEEGNRTITISDEISQEMMRRAMWEVFEEARRRVEAMPIGELPLSPIDTMRRIVEAEGIRTGEITGRKRGIDENGEIYERPKSELGQQAAIETKDEFNNSDLDFLVINQSGSTGISLHASEKVLNKAQRVMLVLQPNLDINEFMQTLGRVHRSGQVTLPAFLLFQTALPAELRPAAILGKKMAMLNANTTSNDKSAVSEGNETVDIFNQYGDEVVLRELAKDRDLQQMLAPISDTTKKLFGEDGKLLTYEQAQEEFAEQPDGYIARMVTGYLAILPVEAQQRFWDAVLAEYNAYIDYLNQTGQNALVAEAVDLKAKTLSREVFVEGSGDTVFDAPAYIERVHVSEGKQPLTGIEAEAAARQALAKAKSAETEYLTRARAFAEEDLQRLARVRVSWDDAKASAHRARQNEAMDTVLAAIEAMGRFGYVQSSGSSALAFVQEVFTDPAAPLTPSKGYAVVRVNNSRDTIKIPLSQFHQAFRPSNTADAQVWEDTKDVGGERTIITGNILRAMQAVGNEGKVISYTKDDGTIQMGLLMPKDFAKKYAAMKRRVKISQPAQLMEAFSQGAIVEGDHVRLRGLPGGQEFEMLVPASKAGGGKVWQNPELNRIARDGMFTQVSSSMRAHFAVERADEVMAILSRIGEGLWMTPKEGNKGTQDESKANFLASASLDRGSFTLVEPGFYSQLQQVLNQKMPNAATPAQVRAIVDPRKGSGVKPEELKWSGFAEAIDRLARENGGKVPKAALLDYLRTEGAVRFEELDLSNAILPQSEREAMAKELDDAVGTFFDWNTEGQEVDEHDSQLFDRAITAAADALRAGDMDAAYEHLLNAASLENKYGDNPTTGPIIERIESFEERNNSRYRDYQLPGGNNYREVVLTMPVDPEKIHQKADREGLTYRTAKRGLTYTSDHYEDIDNYVAHMRLNERPDAQGRDGLFIEEFQSDRHQQGRKYGYAGEKPGVWTLINPDTGGSVGAFSSAEEAEEWKANGPREDVRTWEVKKLQDETGIADAPYRKDWPLALFKRALRHAVAAGKQWIGWTTGDTQAERYQLSKHISFIEWSGMNDAATRPPLGDKTIHLNFNDLTGVLTLGINEAGQIIAASGSGAAHEFSPHLRGRSLSDVVGKPVAERILSEPSGIIRDSALNIGGEGMKGFYDEILPKEVAKYVRKWGAKVEKGKLPESATGVDFWRVDITPAMREGVEAGQSLFSAPLGRATPVDKNAPRREFSNATLVGPTLFTLAASPLTAYHGTPHNVDRFSLDKVGTGEGSQAYGWGLYFASRREVADSYRRNLSAPSIDPANLRPAPIGSTADKLVRKFMQFRVLDESDLIDAGISPDNVPLDENREISTSKFIELGYAADSSVEVDGGGYLFGFEDGSAIYEHDGESKAVMPKLGNLYRVELDVEDADLLDWDKPLSEQSEKVREALEASGLLEVIKNVGAEAGQLIRALANQPRVAEWARRDLLADAERVEKMGDPARVRAVVHSMQLGYGISGTDPVFGDAGQAFLDFVRMLNSAALTGGDNGRAIYDLLSAKLGSPRAASEALLAAGIPGLRYLDGVSRGAGDGTHNYVIFDESKIKIVGQNGEPVAMSLASAPLAPAEKKVIDKLLEAGSPKVRWLADVTAPLEYIGVPEAKLNSATVKAAKWAGKQLKKGANTIRLTDLVARLSDTRAGETAAFAARWVQRQFFPRMLLPQEAAAKLAEARAALAWGAGALPKDLARTLREGGENRFMDFVVPKEATDALVQKQLVEFFRGAMPIDKLPASVVPFAKRVTKLFDHMAMERVKAGIMSEDTYLKRRGSYFPHFFYKYELADKGLRWAWRRMKMNLDRTKPQTSSAWYIERIDPHTNQGFEPPQLLSWNGKEWRFNSAQHRDAWFENFVREEIVKKVRARGNRNFDEHRLTALEQESQDIRDLVEAVEIDIRKQYRMGRPLDAEELERQGLITDLSYVIPKALAQMHHDTILARLFQDIALNPEWTSDSPVSGWMQVPDDPRYGKLRGKYLEPTIANEILELQEAPHEALRLLDAALRHWKTWKTVYNPATHARNLMSNPFFASLAGVSIIQPSNWRYYWDAMRALRGELEGESLQSFYESGLLGGDYNSAELKDYLKGIIIPDKPEHADPLSKLWQTFKRPLKAAEKAYQIEDEVFKVAAYLKQRAEGKSPQEAVLHVRKWFPYYDQVGRSAVLRGIKRFSSPFLSFMQEAFRIGGLAIAEKPLTMARWMAIPGLMTLMSRAALGLGDDDWEAIKRTMKGKVGELPVFSALMPWLDEQGRPVQWDFSNIIPYADMLGRRGGQDDDMPLWSALVKKYFLSGPLTQLGIAWALGQDPYTGRKFQQEGMSQGEVLAEQAKYTGALVLPPLTPGVGTSDPIKWMQADRKKGRFLQSQGRAQVISRQLAGVDVRSALPDLYESANAYRAANNLPLSQFDGSTTARSRATRMAYEAIINEDVKQLTEALEMMRERGLGDIRTREDIERLFNYRNPEAVLKGVHRERWKQTLSPLERKTLNEAKAIWERAKRNAPALINRARQNLKTVTPPNRRLTSTDLRPAA